jgi:ethanolamine ammonia-lyase small subunit
MSGIEKRDPWLNLSRFTAARIALGRAGGSVRTQTLLDFRLAHARAKDAVELPFDADVLAKELAAAGLDSARLETEAADRRSYLQRPDFGRKLRAESRAALSALRGALGIRDLCVVVSDGLSALAAARQAAPLLRELVPLLTRQGLTLFPIFIAPYARVKLADEVGELLGARQSLILLGERPGLSSPDSLGAYVTFGPREACTDADRNCVSNIRDEGLPCPEAAAALAELIVESGRRQLSGVALKLSAPRSVGA